MGRDVVTQFLALALGVGSKLVVHALEIGTNAKKHAKGAWKTLIY